MLKKDKEKIKTVKGWVKRKAGALIFGIFGVMECWSKGARG